MQFVIKKIYLFVYLFTYFFIADSFAFNPKYVVTSLQSDQ